MCYVLSFRWIYIHQNRFHQNSPVGTRRHMDVLWTSPGRRDVLRTSIWRLVPTGRWTSEDHFELLAATVLCYLYQYMSSSLMMSKAFFILSHTTLNFSFPVQFSPYFGQVVYSEYLHPLSTYSCIQPNISLRPIRFFVYGKKSANKNRLTHSL